MKKKNIIILTTQVLIAMLMIFLSFIIYFSIPFDAGDNSWPFARLYLSISRGENLLLISLFISLILSLYLKNDMSRKDKMSLVFFQSYITGAMLLISLFEAFGNVSMFSSKSVLGPNVSWAIFIIPLLFIYLIMNIWMLVKELWNGQVKIKSDMS